VIPVGAAVAGLIVVVLATSALVPEIGLTAIPLGFAAGTLTRLGLLAAALPGRLARLDRLRATARTRAA